MTVESASYISDLNASNPSATDGVLEGDDHIRLIKAVLKSTFPNVTGPVTATNARINDVIANPFPIGGIVMWSGSITSLPSGWALCNGQTVTRTDGGGSLVTPDLRNRFVVGAGSTYAVGATGGTDSVTLTTAQLPSHTHGFSGSATVSSAGAHTHGINDPGHFHTSTSTANGLQNANGSSPARFTAEQGFVYGTPSLDTNTKTTGITIQSVGDHTHSVTISGSNTSVGGGEAHENRPPYYALAYIIKH